VTTVDQPTAPSYFDQLGGAPTISEAVNRFYRLLLNDPELAPYFAGTDMAQLKAHQVKLLSHLLGGPNEYTGRDLAAAHGGLGITDEHYSKVGGYLIDVLTDMGASDEIVAAVGSTLEGARPQVVAAG